MTEGLLRSWGVIDRIIASIFGSWRSTWSSPSGSLDIPGSIPMTWDSGPIFLSACI
jgi:hypothetical protein